MRLALLALLLGACSGCTVEKVIRPLVYTSPPRSNLGSMMCETDTVHGIERHSPFYVVHGAAFDLGVQKEIASHERQHVSDAIDFINAGGSCDEWTQHYKTNPIKYETRAWCAPWQTGIMPRDSAIKWLSFHSVVKGVGRERTDSARTYFDRYCR